MSRYPDTADQAPFPVRRVLPLIVFGGVMFVVLLWMIGSGMTSGSTNDGGAHGGGKGLTGYAAMAEFLERRGIPVRRSVNEGALEGRGLLVLTPPHFADGKLLSQIVEKRRYQGPTLVILPKWIAAAPPRDTPGAKKGWVALMQAQLPEWRGFLDEVSVSITPMRAKGLPARWVGSDRDGGAFWGDLPVSEKVLSGQGTRLVPLVVGQQDGRILAAYVNDSGSYPALDAMALRQRTDGGGSGSIYPVVIVFEPDLINNYGMADGASALLAERLVRATGEDSDGSVIFDLTLNGHSRSANLLTLAFTPPYLAATVCLLLAALAVGWRAFLRFGVPASTTRAIAFGKRALVANAAGLIRRTGRLHLVTGPYAGAVRERLARALSLPRLPDAQTTDAAIDRALASRCPDAEPFSHVAARLAAARRPHDILRAAQDLHSLERTLKT